MIDLRKIRDTEVTHAETLLDKETADRANRHIFLEDRHKRIIVYAVLRFYLEKLIGQKSSEIKILRDSYGKPYLKGLPVHFSISHTEQYAVLAFHPYFPIGIDIEHVRNILNLLEISDLFMHHEEKAKMFHCKDIIGYFFSLWSSKEAFLKAKEIQFDQLPKWNLDINFSFGGYECFSSKQDIYLYGKTIRSHKIAVCVDEKAVLKPKFENSELIRGKSKK
ncbi:MAG: 4'-phosphopantetheinyl transferase superfamily protein [Halobacteriovoraceae bacterium]|nr:4'-phosphopantetheinyl transferase superfamily protein [Halobacteriovoraceae bacterium]